MMQLMPKFRKVQIVKFSPGGRYVTLRLSEHGGQESGVQVELWVDLTAIDMAVDLANDGEIDPTLPCCLEY